MCKLPQTDQTLTSFLNETIEHNSLPILVLLIFIRDMSYSSLAFANWQTYHKMTFYFTKTWKRKNCNSESVSYSTITWTLQTFVIPEDIGFMISALSPFIFTIFVEALFFSVAITKKREHVTIKNMTLYI